MHTHHRSEIHTYLRDPDLPPANPEDHPLTGETIPRRIDRAHPLPPLKPQERFLGHTTDDPINRDPTAPEIPPLTPPPARGILPVS